MSRRLAHLAAILALLLTGSGWLSYAHHLTAHGPDHVGHAAGHEHTDAEPSDVPHAPDDETPDEECEICVKLAAGATVDVVVAAPAPDLATSGVPPAPAQVASIAAPCALRGRAPPTLHI
ncbi:MAG: DUF2946 family protein [Planctomycetota bacterium]